MVPVHACWGFWNSCNANDGNEDVDPACLVHTRPRSGRERAWPRYKMTAPSSHPHSGRKVEFSGRLPWKPGALPRR